MKDRFREHIDGLIDSLVQRAVETDDGSVFSRKEARKTLRRRVGRWSDERVGTLHESYRRGTLSRRRFLHLLGIGAGGAFVAASGAGWLFGNRVFDADGDTLTGHVPAPGSGSVTVNGIQFDRVVDVTDHGSISGAASDGTLVVIPSGERYQFSGSESITGRDRVGVVGQDGAMLVPPQGHNGWLLNCANNRELLLKGFDVDLSASNTTGGIRCITGQKQHIEDIVWQGRGSHPDQGSVVNMFNTAITNSGGEGTIKHVSHIKGSNLGTYKGGSGRVGIWIGAAHSGLMQVEEVDLREFGNDTIYASRNHGQVHVLGGYFSNNGVVGARVSGEGAVVDSLTIENDIDMYTGEVLGGYDFGGVICERGQVMGKPGGAVIRNCHIDIRKGQKARAGIVSWPSGKTLRVEDCTIKVDLDGVPAIRRMPKRPLIGRFGPSSDPRWLRASGCEITGTSSGRAAVVVGDGRDSWFRDGCIDMPNKDAGVLFENSPGSSVSDSCISVAGPQVAGGSFSGLRSGCSCAEPCTRER